MDFLNEIKEICNNILKLEERNEDATRKLFFDLGQLIRLNTELPNEAPIKNETNSLVTLITKQYDSDEKRIKDAKNHAEILLNTINKIIPNNETKEKSPYSELDQKSSPSESDSESNPPSISVQFSKPSLTPKKLSGLGIAAGIIGGLLFGAAIATITVLTGGIAPLVAGGVIGIAGAINGAIHGGKEGIVSGFFKGLSGAFAILASGISFLASLGGSGGLAITAEIASETYETEEKKILKSSTDSMGIPLGTSVDNSLPKNTVNNLNLGANNAPSFKITNVSGDEDKMN